MRGLKAVIACGLVLIAGNASASTIGIPPAEGWTITSGVIAPWAPEKLKAQKDAALPNDDLLRDAALAFDPGRVVGPSPLGCEDARYEFVLSPAEGMFQGAIETDAPAAMRALGVNELPVLTMQVSCETGVFDYHRIAPGKLLLGLDNVVWTLSNEKAARSPEAAVLDLYAVHMSGDMGFTPALVESKRRFLTKGLNAEIDAYFARPAPKDEPPVINGDPFTGTQEYPTRFSLEPAAISGAEATVPFVFTDGARKRTVTAVLRKDGSAWLLDDLRYEDGETFRKLLGPRAQP
jgi:hypothetical protein